MEDNSKALLDVLKHYAVPDPKIVGKLPKGGRQLDFVGHADINKILIEIDPNWRWVPCGWENGRPAIHVANGMATMWGTPVARPCPTWGWFSPGRQGRT